MSPEMELVQTVYRALVEESPVPADARQVSEAALSGSNGEPPWFTLRKMAQAANDPHTMVLSGATVTAMNGVIAGQSVVMPGFTIHRTGENTFVAGDLFPGGAAEEAGMLLGDRVLSIDDVPVTRGTEDLLHVFGRPEGDEARVEIDRGGKRCVLQLRLTRWQQQMVTSRALGRGVGYVKLRFVTTSDDAACDAAALLGRAIEALSVDAPTGLILDLRSNPGGYGVTRVASVLTDGDPILIYRDRTGNEELARRSTDRAAAADRPLAVLVDDQTLSSAEMITLALKEHRSARVIGQPTAGGLTVPRYVPLGDGYVLMVPERIAVGPRSRRSPLGLRITPDIIVPNRTAEDFALGRDPQLDAAIEQLVL